MKKLQLNIIIGLIFLSAWANAQSYTFKVLSASGTNTKNSAGLLVGSVLSSTDQISVGAGSYLNLMYTAGGSVSINKQGSYSVADLARQVESQRASSGGKFVNYVIGEATKGGNDINQNHASYMKTTGSQERATFNQDNVAIIFIVPVQGNAILTYDPKVYLHWASEKSEISTYIVEFKDLSDAIVQKFETKETSTIVDFSKIKFVNPEMSESIIVSVKSKEDPDLKSIDLAVNYNKDSQFYKTIKPKFDSYKKNNEFSADVPESVKKIDEAFFFEENKAYTDAIRCYEEAISLEPDATPFKIAYNEFFNRLYSMDESSNKK